MKKISKSWSNLISGVLIIIISSFCLFANKSDPLRDHVRFMMETIPFLVMLFFGILLTIKSILKIKQEKNGIDNTAIETNTSKVLNVATKTFGILTIVGICIFLIPVMYFMFVMFLWVTN